MAINPTEAIDAFLVALEPGWTIATRHAVHSVLWRLEGACQDRPGGLYDSAQDVIALVDGMVGIFPPHAPLDTGTKRYYYGVIRHLYRWLRVNHPGGDGLPALPPWKFGRKPYTRRAGSPAL